MSDKAKRYAAFRKKKVGDKEIWKSPGRRRREAQIEDENRVRRNRDEYERDPEVIKESNEEAKKSVLDKGMELVRDIKEEDDFIEKSRQDHTKAWAGISKGQKRRAEEYKDSNTEIRHKIASLPTLETDRLEKRRADMDRGTDPDTGKDIRREAMRDYFINRERGLSPGAAAKNTDKLGWAEKERLQRGADARLQGYDDDRASRSRAAQDAADSERKVEEAEAEARAKAAHYAAFRKQQQPKFDEQEAEIKKAESDNTQYKIEGRNENETPEYVTPKRAYITLTPRENPDQPKLPGDKLPGGMRSESDEQQSRRAAYIAAKRRRERDERNTF